MAQKQTLVCTGFEHGAQTVGTGKALRGASGNYAVQSSYVITGNYSLRLQPTDSAVAWVQLHQDGPLGWPIGGASVRLRFRGSLPSTDLVVLLETGQISVPTGYGFAFHAASGGIRPFWYDSASATFTYGTPSGAISADVDYRIEWIVDEAPGAAGTVVDLDWFLAAGDGPATAQSRFTFTVSATIGQGLGLFCGNRVGPTSTCDLLVDDVLLLYSAAPASDNPPWPFTGSIAVVGLPPSADGTHANAADFTDNLGNSPPASVWDRLDELPWGDASADHVYQDTVNTASYLEVELAALPSDAVNAAGGTLLGTFTASGAGATRLDVRVVDPVTGTFTRQIAYTNGATSVTWMRVDLLPVAPNELSVAMVDRCVVRAGFSSDVTPFPRCESLMLEVAYQRPPPARWGWGILLS